MTHVVKWKNFIIIPILISSLCITALFLLASELKDAFILGVRLAVGSILHSVFPFMILADYMSASISKISRRLVERISRRLGISSQGVSLLLIGLLCGFPVGARTVANAYLRGTISREECERLCAVANAPSPVFVISGIGLIRGSIVEGVLLYASVVCSALICTAVFPGLERFSPISNENQGQNFDISDSIKRAGNASITICAFVIFFSMVNSLVKKLLPSPYLSAIVCCFLEIGNAAKTLKETALPQNISLGLCGFSLGFSGLSVLLQSFAFIPPEISRKRIVFTKLLQGAIAFILCLGAASIT